ncbi:MAG: glycosyltransferase [Fibrobacteres bacterium]|nr:glycosyltransferase [Fibrobacterota bacterium]
MNILHLVSDLGRGGRTLSILQNILMSDRSKYKSTLMFGSADNEENVLQLQARAEGFELVKIPSLKAGIRPISDYLALQTIKKTITGRKFDLLVAHGTKASIIGMIAAKECGIENVCHIPYGQLSWDHKDIMRTLIVRALRKLYGKQNNTFVALSEDEKQSIQKLYLVHDASVQIVHAGVDLNKVASTQRIDARVRLNIRDNVFVICTVASFIEDKNHDILLEAARILRSARVPFLWMFLGDGPSFQSFRRTAQTSGLIEKFFFAGWIENVYTFLPACDTFCLAPTSEPLGRAFIEAQAEGLPVVASRVGVIPEIVMHRKTGFLHAHDDPNAIAGSLKKLYDDMSTRKAMGEEAKSHVSNAFSAEIMVKRLEAVFDSTIQAKSESQSR